MGCVALTSVSELNYSAGQEHEAHIYKKRREQDMSNFQEQGDAATVVSQMLEACARHDPEAAAEFFADDAFYLAVAFPPKLTGKAAVSESLNQISLIADLKINIVQQVQAGEVVMNRRAETWTWLSDGAEVGLEIMAHFVVENGLITEWTDFFDPVPAQFASHGNRRIGRTDPGPT
jgi:limonene-1,2-epoxide hydrolase